MLASGRFVDSHGMAAIRGVSPQHVMAGLDAAIRRGRGSQGQEGFALPDPPNRPEPGLDRFEAAAVPEK